MTEQAPEAAPKPGFLKLAVTFFEHEITVGIDEARSLIQQGVARDAEAAKAAIEKAEADLRAFHAGSAPAPNAAAPAPKVSASGQAAPPAGDKPRETP